LPTFFAFASIRPVRTLQLLALAGTLGLFVVGTAVAATPRVVLPYAMTVRILDESSGTYQVEVDNTNPARYITGFHWTPPGGLTIVTITSTVGGKCRLPGDGTIACTGEAAPPVGGQVNGASMIVDFRATGLEPKWMGTYWTHYGVIGAVQVTTGGFSDLPLCKKSQTSTRAHPCARV
jgi:hypothetical protein